MKRVAVGAITTGLLLASAVLAQDSKTIPKAVAPAPKAASAAPAAAGELKTNREKASYGLGLSMGRSFKTQSVDLNIDLLVKGIKDGMGGGQALLTDEQAQQALAAFQQELTAHQEQKAKKEGETYLAANAKKEGVKVLPSGLQYKVLKEGNGPSPKASDTVTTHYKGTLTDGTEFDSSYKRGEPATFPVGGVIKGWTEALQLMKVGSKWQLVIPSELAYGATPRPGGPIPPHATLVFEVELLGIQK